MNKHHHASCASFRLRTIHPQVTSSQCRNSATLATTAALTCHNRAKTTTLSTGSSVITYDDSCKLEAEQIPTSTTNPLPRRLANTEGITQSRPMTSQAALISSGSKQSSGQHEQVSHSCTFSRTEEHCMIEDDYLVNDLLHDDNNNQQQLADQQPTQEIQCSNLCSNRSMQSPQVNRIQPSLTTLSAFVNGANNNNNHHSRGKQMNGLIAFVGIFSR